MNVLDRKLKNFKVILLGDSGVGKTSLVNQFVNNYFLKTHSATVGTDYFVKNVTMEQQDVILQLWDTAGQERFQSLGNSFYRGTHCCILVYDVTRPGTLASLQQWKEQFLHSVQPNDPIGFPFVVIGNKLDLLEDGFKGVYYKKSLEDDERDIPSFVASAKDARNVELAFRAAAKRILQREMESDYDFIRREEVRLLHIRDQYSEQSCCYGS